ncbi:hypothetical protein [Micromonospora sp. CNB394]|uniref:hypothetical protein n=1 Tax=Micromonospora sp. CNB394 TaxID=1169151 RepID=UPI0003749896|nr:hypothetical protein [Micromonospora sp. CNB394]
MCERVRLAVAASILEEGHERIAAIEALEEYQKRPIWRPKKKREGGPRVVVQDQARFLSEMARLGLEIPDHRVVDNELVPTEDPEATAERNTLVAEQLSMDLETAGRLM